VHSRKDNPRRRRHVPDYWNLLRLVQWERRWDWFFGWLWEAPDQLDKDVQKSSGSSNQDEDRSAEDDGHQHRTDNVERTTGDTMSAVPCTSPGNWTEC
jgi:hypothetical protein